MPYLRICLCLALLLPLTGCRVRLRYGSKSTPVVGGVYSVDNDKGGYYVMKILDIEPGIVHLQTYADEFKTRPKMVNTKGMPVLVGHMPMAMEGFARGNPRIICKEPVYELQTEGLRRYRAEMQKKSP